jgi:hypothetical protein
MRNRKTRGAPARPGVAETIRDYILNAMRGGATPEVARAFAMLTDETGQNIFRYTGSVIRGDIRGRPAIDDSAALLRIASVPPADRREAVGKVARQIVGPGTTPAEAKAAERRLRRKRKKRNGQKGSTRRPHPLRPEP